MAVGGICYKESALKHWHFGPPTPIYFVAVEKWPKLLCHLYLLVNGFLIGHMSLDGFFGEISTQSFLKFMFSKKVTKIDEIFTVDLTLFSECQIDGEDFVNFYGRFKNREL
jgi:hypothetical protein